MSLTRHPDATGATVVHIRKGRFVVTERTSQTGAPLTQQDAIAVNLPDWLVREFTVALRRRGSSDAALWWDYAYTPAPAASRLLDEDFS